MAHIEYINSEGSAKVLKFNKEIHDATCIHCSDKIHKVKRLGKEFLRHNNNSECNYPKGIGICKNGKLS